MVLLLSPVLVGKVAFLLLSHPPALAVVLEGRSYPPLTLKKDTRSPESHRRAEAPNTRVRLERTAFPLRLLFSQLGVVMPLGIQLLPLGYGGTGCSKLSRPLALSCPQRRQPLRHLCLSPKASGMSRGGKEGSSAASPAAGSPRLLGVETQNHTNRNHIGD